MQRKLPGIDIPAATEAKILHAAAFFGIQEPRGEDGKGGLGPSSIHMLDAWYRGVALLLRSHYWDGL